MRTLNEIRASFAMWRAVCGEQADDCGILLRALELAVGMLDSFDDHKDDPEFMNELIRRAQEEQP